MMALTKFCVAMPNPILDGDFSSRLGLIFSEMQNYLNSDGKLFEKITSSSLDGWKYSIIEIGMSNTIHSSKVL